MRTARGTTWLTWTAASSVLIGAGLLALYFFEAVYLRWGEGDQSLLFWYSPFLLFGGVSMLTGIILFLHGRKKNEREERSRPRA